MFFFLISCFTFVFFFKSQLKSYNKNNLSVLFLLQDWFCSDKNKTFDAVITCFCQGQVWKSMQVKRNMNSSCVPVVVESKPREPEQEISLLDLPELALECILERLSPVELRDMSAVCSSLREKCVSDHLWERHLKQKWGRLIGDAAYKEWHRHVASSAMKKSRISDRESSSNENGFFGSLGLSVLRSFSWIRLKGFDSNASCRDRRISLPADSVMALYLSLENGKFWFPGQVYNRENGNLGFMLSCYDAQLSYDCETDTFQARYSPNGRRKVEECINWDRLRAPPVDAPANVLHISDCLHDLKPGDHVEIQWRRSKEFPYGWWYAVVGHVGTCYGTENECRCQHNDIVVLEFNQYALGSRWRRTTLKRADHHEEGNEADGFYGGIRKLYKEEEISSWKLLWPKQIFE